MTSSRQQRTWIFGTSRRAATAALAMVLALTVVPTPAAHAQTFTVLHNFTNGQDGAFPFAGLTIKAGNLYGTAFDGGLGDGTVFELTPKRPGWRFHPLYSFPANESGGAEPQARVIVGPNGTLYGTTRGGGNNAGGVVFNLKHHQPQPADPLSAPWTETVLYNFPEYHGDASPPGTGDVVFDQAGNLYGTTTEGGSDVLGAVYELTPSGTESVLHSFAGGSDGSYPYSGVIFDGSGNLYGTTSEGGDGACGGGCGTVYKMTPSGSGWTERPIYSFTGESDGARPYGGLIFHKGNLYGTTFVGGKGLGGTVFKLTPNSDGSWKFHLLYSFAGNAGPDGSLTMYEDTLYGITGQNDPWVYGEVFELTLSGAYTPLYDFKAGDDGCFPHGNVVLDASGNIYGTAEECGKNGYGTVWELTP
jgi:uncharacterized repeat protein (TIGR03803 family)